MARTPFGPVLALSLLAGVLLAPASAYATSFLPLWTLTAWTYDQDIGNTDGDPQHELLVHSKADGHLALVDALTGAVEQEFPEFKAGETNYLIQNVDGDPRLEFFLTRIAPVSGPYVPLTKAYKWTPGGYVTLFTHTDPVQQFLLVHLRTASQTELIEISDQEVRVRDMTGNVLLAASSAIATWDRVDPYIWLGDLDGDGISELGLMENAGSSLNQTWFFHYDAGFHYMWSSAGWFMEGAQNTDGDAHAEVLASNAIDGRYAFFDGVSGTPDLELPEFTTGTNSQVFAADVDGDGRQEIFASRPSGLGVTPLVRAYKWTTGGYVQMFSHTQEMLSGSPVHTRSATQLEFVDVAGGDVVIRDAVAGTVLFRASTQIPGWSGTNLSAYPFDLDKDGVLELIVQDNTTARVVRYSAGAYAQLWSSTSWQNPFPEPKLDDFPLDGLLASASGDGHWGLLDPFTGAVRQEFPTFLSSQGSAIAVEFDHISRKDLLMVRHAFSVSPLTTCYRWHGSSFFPLFSNTDDTNGFLAAPVRSVASNDLLELGYSNGANNDVRVRASNGSVIFSASTGIPGWTGVGVPGNLDTLDVDHDGVVEFLAVDNVATRLMRYGGTLGVEDRHDGLALQLLGSSPNPFRTATTLHFSTRNAGDVGIAIFDASGRLVRRLDQRFTAGSHEVKWDGRDEGGHAVPNGVLFYEVKAAGVHQTRKLVRLGR